MSGVLRNVDSGRQQGVLKSVFEKGKHDDWSFAGKRMCWPQHSAWMASLLTYWLVIAITKAGMRVAADAVIRDIPGGESTGPGTICFGS